MKLKTYVFRSGGFRFMLTEPEKGTAIHLFVERTDCLGTKYWAPINDWNERSDGYTVMALSALMSDAREALGLPADGEVDPDVPVD